nr:response regulator [uncultured Rhodopila sp.]
MQIEPAIPTVFVVEDDPEARDRLCLHLQVAGLVVKSYESAEAFLLDHTPELTGCLITDVRLPRMDGVRLVEELSRRPNRLPVIVISGYAETPLVVEAMRAGAVDFLNKPLDPAILLRTLHAAMQQATTTVSLRSEAAAAGFRISTLSPREREVFDGFTRGLSTKQVANELGVSPKTIETHRSHLYEKLKVDTPYALVRIGVLRALLGHF